MKWKWFIYGFLAFGLLSAGFTYWKLTATHPVSRGEMDDAPLGSLPHVSEKPLTEEEKDRVGLLGVWQDEYKGKRTMTLNEDGSGTMLVELSGAQAFLFEPRLRFQMKWSLVGKKLTQRSLGGDPPDKANLILNTMGDTAHYTLLELTKDRLFLLDQDGKTKYDWKRSPGEVQTNWP